MSDNTVSICQTIRFPYVKPCDTSQESTCIQTERHWVQTLQPGTVNSYIVRSYRDVIVVNQKGATRRTNKV